MLLKKLYDKLVIKINAMNTIGFGLKTQYNTDKSIIENKIDGGSKKIPELVYLLQNRL